MVGQSTDLSYQNFKKLYGSKTGEVSPIKLLQTKQLIMMIHMTHFNPTENNLIIVYYLFDTCSESFLRSQLNTPELIVDTGGDHSLHSLSFLYTCSFSTLAFTGSLSKLFSNKNKKKENLFLCLCQPQPVQLFL